MSADGFTCTADRFDHAVRRLAATSRKSAVEVLADEAKRLFALVAKITPPGNEFASGRAAEKQGKSAVAADIYATYGTPSDAYDVIVGNAGKPQADAFWALYQGGAIHEAKEVFDAVSGHTIALGFDGGAAHASGGRGRRNRRRRAHAAFTFAVESVASFVEDKQGAVWWLASGWARALRALGARLPTGVGKHNAPGKLSVIANDALVEVKMINKVSFAGEVRGIKRRIRSAMRIRTDVLQRRWDGYMGRAARGAGFKTRSRKQ